jgi:hypothetical protein
MTGNASPAAAEVEALRAVTYARRVDADTFDEAELYACIAASGARALLIGRRAVIAWGIPVITSDYDLWIPSDDAEALNRALAPLGLVPNRPPEEARNVGRYVLENSERVDVLVARVVSTVDGEPVRFEEVWERRETLELAAGVELAVPCIDDLIRTKRFGSRPKDAEDIRLLRALKEARE